ncbi:MAG TPA: YibE/F family protein [Bacillota bacterium]|nr:YibE/F family protein [Bacillota bacterium]HPT87224.1 YibE/F family protein [Bacillota bacterium]
MNTWHKALLIFIVLGLSAGFLSGYVAAAEVPEESVETVTARGKVLEVVAEEPVQDPLNGESTVNQKLRVRLLSGEYKGKVITVYNYQTSNPVFNIAVKQGDAVLVALELSQNGAITGAFIADHLRERQLLLLALIFLVIVLAVSWKHGAKAIAALVLTLVLVGGILVPGLLRGYNPILLSVITAALATGITIMIVGGWSLKSLAAILGTVGGVTFAGILALVVGKAAHLTGFGTEEAAMLLYIPQQVKLDIQGILFAGIIIGALGAAMDVSISVASAVTEIKRVNPELETSDLITSGMNVGKDIIGTMTNTLILAYTGSSLQLILLFMAYRESLMKVINLDMVASEIVRALAGSIGLVMVVPITACISGWLLGRQRK